MHPCANITGAAKSRAQKKPAKEDVVPELLEPGYESPSDSDDYQDEAEMATTVTRSGQQKGDATKIN